MTRQIDILVKCTNWTRRCITSVDDDQTKTIIKDAMESSVSLELAKHALLMFGSILAVGTFSGLIARLVRIPDVAVFLLVGMLLGPGVLGLRSEEHTSELQSLTNLV